MLCFWSCCFHISGRIKGSDQLIVSHIIEVFSSLWFPMVSANVNQQTAVALFLDVPILCVSCALYGAFAIQFELTEVLRNDLSADFFFLSPLFGVRTLITQQESCMKCILVGQRATRNHRGQSSLLPAALFARLRLRHQLLQFQFWFL